MEMICFGLFVMTCHPTGAPAQHASFCQVYAPIYWSKRDTRATKQAIDTANAKWKRLCGKA